MRRLNVQLSQIEECIRKSKFALPSLPRTPPIARGEALLLQLVLDDARRLGKERSRIEFALVFEHVEEDPTGELSRKYWPDAPKTWRYILHCSETIPTIPFSLELLDLRHSYAGQNTAAYIHPVDQEKIRPFLKGGTPPVELWSVASVDGLLRAIRNYDEILRLAPRQKTLVREHRRDVTDPWLPDALKRFYNHRCQLCLHDFEPRYGVPYADTCIVSDRQKVPVPASRDLVVVCPNHNAIIGAARATFDRRRLAFRYPNGLLEEVMLRDHLLTA
jgi:hypothetical protein